MISCEHARFCITGGSSKEMAHSRQVTVSRPGLYLKSRDCISECVLLVQNHRSNSSANWAKANARPASGHCAMCWHVSMHVVQHTGIDEILQEYGILRAQYHGCDMSGGHLSKLMTYITKIMEKVQTYLLLKVTKPLNVDAPTPANDIATPVTTAEDEIRRTCLNVRTYLLLWNKFLSLVKTEYPTSANCDETQKRIGDIVELAGSMGKKRSLKMHTCMVHLVPQMCRFKCGLSDFARVLQSYTIKRDTRWMSNINM